MNKRILLIVVLFFNLLISSFGSLEYKITLLNNLFLTSMLLLIIGGSLFLLEGGFFNIVIYGFKKFYQKFSPVGRYVTEKTNQNNKVVSFEFTSTNSLLIVGGTIFSVTFLIGLII